MVVAAYNAAKHETTGYSPYYLQYGREYRTPLDFTLDIPIEQRPRNDCDYVAAFEERLRSAYTSVNQHLHTITERMKQRYNSKVHAFQLEPGQMVLYYCPRRKRSQYQKWRRLCRVCQVVARFNDVLYSIRLTPKSKPVIVHIDRLRKFQGDTPDIWKRYLPFSNHRASDAGQAKASGV